jgi:hypothetical protein
MLAMSALAGCSTYFSHDGPRYGAVAAVQKKGHEQGALLVDLTDASARQVSQSNQSAGFLDMFGQGSPYGALIGPGDTLQVSILKHRLPSFFQAAYPRRQRPWQLDWVAAVSAV